MEDSIKKIKRRNKNLIIHVLILLFSTIISFGGWTILSEKLIKIDPSVVMLILFAIPLIELIYAINTFLIWDSKTSIKNQKLESSFYFGFKISLHVLFLISLIFILFLMIK